MPCHEEKAANIKGACLFKKSYLTSELTGCNGICQVDLAATYLLPEIIAEISDWPPYMLLPPCRQAD